MLGDILAAGKNSRLYKRLVYEEQLAQWVSAGQQGRPLGGQFGITVQAKPGVDLDRILAIVDEEVAKVKATAADAREVQRSRNNIESQFLQRIETSLGRADLLNSYYTYTGDPGYVEEDFARYAGVTPQSVQEAARKYLTDGRLIMSVVPQGQTQLQASQ